MGFFFNGWTPATIISAIVLILALALLSEFTRRSFKFSMFVYIFLPVLIAVLIALDIVKSPSSQTWFGVVKTYSALVGVWGFLLIRFSKLGQTKFTFYFPVTILALNIMEAIFRDIEVYRTFKVATTDAAGLYLQGGVWNLLNALAGVFLLLTLTGWMGIKVSRTKTKDMIWADQLWFWILAYDMWNVAYCYNCISTRAMYSGIALIVACTILEFFVLKGAWLEHRAQTLAIFGMFSLAFDYQSVSYFQITASYNPTAWTVLSAAALITNLAVFIYEIYVIVKLHRNPLREEMFTHLHAYKENLRINNLEKI